MQQSMTRPVARASLQYYNALHTIPMRCPSLSLADQRLVAPSPLAAHGRTSTLIPRAEADWSEGIYAPGLDFEATALHTRMPVRTQSIAYRYISTCSTFHLSLTHVIHMGVTYDSSLPTSGRNTADSRSREGRRRRMCFEGHSPPAHPGPCRLRGPGPSTA